MILNKIYLFMHLFRTSLRTCKRILIYRGVTTNRQDSIKLIVFIEGLERKKVTDSFPSRDNIAAEKISVGKTVL